MILKLIGATLVIAGCGGFGFRLAANHRKEERMLRELIAVLDFMECELQYRLTSLPILCRQAATQCSNSLRNVMLSLSSELEDQISPDVEQCMTAALSKQKDFPVITYETLVLLGRTLGRFDLEGQLKGMDAVKQECHRHLEQLNQNKDIRLRNYQTLGLCAGAAMAILFM